MDIINRLTIGDIAIVEDLSGQSISALSDDNAPKGKALAALAYVVKRKQDKEFTFANALELSMEEVTEILGLDADADPKDEV